MSSGDALHVIRDDVMLYRTLSRGCPQRGAEEHGLSCSRETRGLSVSVRDAPSALGGLAPTPLGAPSPSPRAPPPRRQQVARDAHRHALGERRPAALAAAKVLTRRRTERRRVLVRLDERQRCALRISDRSDSPEGARSRNVARPLWQRPS